MTVLPSAAHARKAIPIATGCVDYFPDALAAVAELSRIGNDQHNPGKPLHWDRSKSTDEADCLMRHFVDRGKRDSDGVRHSVKVAWRALALLQKEIEAERGRAVPKPESKFGFTVGETVNTYVSVYNQHPGTVVGFVESEQLVRVRFFPDLATSLWPPAALRHGP